MGVFEDALHTLARRQHQSTLSDMVRRREPAWLAQWLRSGQDGFLAPAKAAEVMGVDEETVREMARRGQLEWRSSTGRVLVRPAIVSMLAVRTR